MEDSNPEPFTTQQFSKLPARPLAHLPEASLEAETNTFFHSSDESVSIIFPIGRDEHTPLLDLLAVLEQNESQGLTLHASEHWVINFIDFPGVSFWCF